MHNLLMLIFLLYSCSSKKIAKIKFNQLEINFIIKRGANFEANYDFINTGDDSLRILSVDGDCSCTLINFPKNALAPGMKGEIIVTYNSSNDSLGTIVKTVLVESNTKPILHTIKLKGVLK